MCPIVNRNEAKESGFAQIREALIAFEGDVTRAEFGQWGGQLTDDAGKLKPPREFLEVECVNVVVTEVTEELAFIPDEWNFRVNCSDYKGSFWIEDFLASADENKILIPDGLTGKRILWKKVTREALDKDGTPTPKFNSTNFVISKVLGVVDAPTPVKVTTPVVTPKATTPAVVTPAQAEEETTESTTTPQPDPMEAATQLAIGKTETQFRSAISLHPQFVGSPLLAMAKAGLITASLVEQGKLVAVVEGNKTVYRLPS